MKKIAPYILTVLALSAPAFSCQRAEVLRSPSSSGGPIRFAVRDAGPLTATRSTLPPTSREVFSTPGGDTLYLSTEIAPMATSPASGTAPASRVAPYSSSFPFPDFSVIGYTYTSPSDSAKYGEVVTATRSGDYYIPGTALLWPNKGSIRFYAYAPSEAPVSGFGSADGAAAQRITYTVPSAAATQYDLMVASKDTTGVHGEEAGDHYPVTLSFTHILSGVNFIIDRDLSVRGITLSGVRSSGTYDITTGTWSLGTATSTFTMDVTDAYTGTVSTDYGDGIGYSSASAGHTFMMLPQRLDGATITVTFTDGTSVTKPITGTWAASCTYTYRISDGVVRYVIGIETQPAALSHAAGSTVTYKVRSYRYIDKADGVERAQTAIPWTVSYYDRAAVTAAYDAEKADTVYTLKAGATALASQPSWIAALSTSGDGSVSYATETVTAAQNTNGKLSTTIRATLAAHDVTPDGSYWNLANPTGGDAIVESANSYIVNGYGNFRIPLVYGAAIDAGHPTGNTAAYIPGTPAARILDHFPNSYNQPITSPYIHKDTSDGSTPIAPATGNGAVDIIWTNVAGMVSGQTVEYDSAHDVYWLKFTIDPSAIDQGNVLMSVKGTDGNILWSYHVWVTNYVPGIGDQYVDGSYIMPVYLGWMEDAASGNDLQAPNEAFLCIAQSEGNAYTLVRLRQTGAVQTSAAGVATYYQWGRPVPLRIYGDSANIDATVASSFGVVLRSPDTAFREADGNYDCFYVDLNHQTRFNLWGANQTTWADKSLALQKSIYDPCPPGYMVPSMGVLDHFTTANGSWDGRAYAMRFALDDAYGNSQDIIFPAIGLHHAATGGHAGSNAAVSFYHTGMGVYSANTIQVASSYMRYYPPYAMTYTSYTYNGGNNGTRAAGYSNTDYYWPGGHRINCAGMNIRPVRTE